MSKDTTLRLGTLRAIPLFEGLSDETLQKVLELADEVEAPAGITLIEPEHEGAGMFILEQGEVVVERGGHKVNLGPGEFFGEMALLTPHGHRSARVRTTVDSKLIVVPRSAFTEMLHAEPEIAVRMLGVLAGRLAEALKH